MTACSGKYALQDNMMLSPQQVQDILHARHQLLMGLEAAQEARTVAYDRLDAAAEVTFTEPYIACLARKLSIVQGCNAVLMITFLSADAY